MGLVVPSAKPLILYLHGFNSSPRSKKALQTMAFLNQNAFHCDCLVPALSYSPSQAIASFSAIIKHEQPHREVCLIGSSLGGYYATHLAEQLDLKAVLINPAVRPFELLRSYIGENENLYTGKRFTLSEHHLQELIDIHHPQILKPKNFLILLQTADETLDYQQAVKAFQQSSAWISHGGDHGFQKWLEYLPAALNFLGVAKLGS